MMKRGIVAALVLMMGNLLIGEGVESKGKTVAVMPFRFGNTDLGIGQGYTDIRWEEKDSELLREHVIRNLLAQTPLKVMERARLGELEAEYARGGKWIDVNEKLKVLRCDYLVLGTIELFEVEKQYKNFESSGISLKGLRGKMVVGLKVVEVATSQVLYAQRVEEQLEEWGRKDKEVSALGLVDQLKERVVRKLVHRIGEGIAPIRVMESDMANAYLNRGEGSLLEVGTVLRVYNVGKAMKDPNTGEVVGYQQEEVATVKVVDVYPKMTKAQVLKYSGKIKEGDYCRLVEDEERVDGRKVPPLRGETEASGEKPVKW